LFLFFWFTAAILHSSSRILQYLLTASDTIVFDAKIGAISNYLIVWISINFIGSYTNYKLKKYEKIIWFFVLAIPVLLIVFSELYIGNNAIERHTIFNEIFYGATTGKYYPVFPFPRVSPQGYSYSTPSESAYAQLPNCPTVQLSNCPTYLDDI